LPPIRNKALNGWRNGRAPARTPDRHLPQRTVSTMRRVVTDFDNSKKLYAAPIPAALVR
jgi:hypothetical protein